MGWIQQFSIFLSQYKYIYFFTDMHEYECNEILLIWMQIGMLYESIQECIYEYSSFKTFKSARIPTYVTVIM